MSPGAVEEVIRMPAISMAALENLAERVLEEIAPTALSMPSQLDIVHLIDHVLPKYGIHVTPVEDWELPGSEAETLPDGTADIDILIRKEQWQYLLAGGRQAHRARATVGHELGHAILHVPVIRRRRDSPQSQHLLRRVRNDAIKPYESPEWQAWALGACILAPRRTINMLPRAGAVALGEVYGVSEAMMRLHLKRLRIER